MKQGPYGLLNRGVCVLWLGDVFWLYKGGIWKISFCTSLETVSKERRVWEGGVESHFSSIYYEWLRCREPNATPRRRSTTMLLSASLRPSPRQAYLKNFGNISDWCMQIRGRCIFHGLWTWSLTVLMLTRWKPCLLIKFEATILFYRCIFFCI